VSAFPLRAWAGRWAVCRLASNAAVPEWAAGAARLLVVARTAGELSIIAPEERVPGDVQAARGFRVIEVCGPVPFTVVGLMASLAKPLAEAGISLLPVATYDTDYVLVQEADLARAIEVLRGAGFRIE
jgi:hypothetical protein